MSLVPRSTISYHHFLFLLGEYPNTVSAAFKFKPSSLKNVLEREYSSAIPVELIGFSHTGRGRTTLLLHQFFKWKISGKRTTNPADII
jgi:hypothetical protein